MNSRRALRLAAVVVPLTALGWAQDWIGAGRSEAPKVEVAPVGPVKVTPGRDSSVALYFRVKPSFHINSNTPGSDLLIPTALKLSPPTNIVVGSTTYPEGKDMEFAFAPGQKLNVYTGDFQLTTRVIAARNTPPGKYRVHGELKYQACDARACYPPSKLPVVFDVAVLRATSARTRRNPAQSPHAR